MSIKFRLIVSYMAMLIVPFVLSLIALSVVASFYVKSIDRAYDIKHNGHPLQSNIFKSNPLKDLFNKNSLILMDIEKDVEMNPDILENNKYLSNLDNKFKLTKSFLLVYVTIVILIMILINGILTFWVSKKIVKALIALKNASSRIKEGDLDFEVKSNTNDEIGELCKEFQDMKG
ncbi:HAMP domain-containing protein [Clostridium psychrophilum]|uniref:HAMP domain-containing protein n=1 Tax=Clostridium psychrophilum TaxID=132926 RepID=UPI001C0BF94A|nr:HAMP domain-containing protein [Clostridium psychrophilum]MBU3181300.1 HAMP domain-containing protein [Clostridium psychrophilum]